MNPIQIVIVDDHPVVRAGLEGMLSAQEDFDVVGEADNGIEAISTCKRAEPDLVLMDLRMPGMDGVEAIEQIKAERPDSNILVLTTYDSDADIVKAVEAGATGYLLKDAPRETLFQAVRSAARGESVLAPTVAAKLMTRLRTQPKDQLSNREVEVLTLVSRGRNNREIGHDLHISIATVKTHLIHIFDKLDVHDRTAAVTVAIERGILTLEK